jgi:hypothetical protein
VTPGVVPHTTPSTHVPNGDVLIAQKKNNQEQKKTMQIREKKE